MLTLIKIAVAVAIGFAVVHPEYHSSGQRCELQVLGRRLGAKGLWGNRRHNLILHSAVPPALVHYEPDNFLQGAGWRWYGMIRAGFVRRGLGSSVPAKESNCGLVGL